MQIQLEIPEKATRVIIFNEDDEEIEFRIIDGRAILKEDLDEPDDISALELNTRLKYCMARAEIHRVSELLEYGREELLRIRNLGETSLDELADSLYRHGYVEDCNRLAFPDDPSEEINEARANPNSVLNLSLNVSVRNKLYRAGIRTTDQLKKITINDLMSIKSFNSSELRMLEIFIKGMEARVI